MLNIVICERDREQLEYLADLVREHPFQDAANITVFENVGAFIQYMEHYGHHQDVIIINIALGEFNGIKLVHIIQERLPHIQVIFVSQFAELVFDAYAVRHIAFVPVPIELKYMHTALKSAESYMKIARKPHLMLASQGLISRINLDDIVYMESNLRQLEIHTVRDVMRFQKQLGSLKSMLDYRFLQCHKSFIVNLDYVTAMDISNTCMLLKTGDSIPISTRKQREAKEVYLSYSCQF